MLMPILLVVLAVIDTLILLIATRPADFRIVRSAAMTAPPSKVFAQVNDFHKWDAWSPWAKRDPNMTTTFDGPNSGKGATYAWSGNKEVGQGRMTITESEPYDRIEIRLEFMKPMKATNTAEFTFKPEGDKTIVTWSMHGRNNFMGKAFSLIMNMDKILGGEFEKGLASMKTVVEDSLS